MITNARKKSFPLALPLSPHNPVLVDGGNQQKRTFWIKLGKFNQNNGVRSRGRNKIQIQPCKTGCIKQETLLSGREATVLLGGDADRRPIFSLTLPVFSWYSGTIILIKADFPTLGRTRQRSLPPRQVRLDLGSALPGFGTGTNGSITYFPVWFGIFLGTLRFYQIRFVENKQRGR